MTPAAANCRLAVERFDFITRVGVYNRRKISGTSAWSQHSWANALDLLYDGTSWVELSRSDNS